jgi:hypothetical protein
MDDYSYAFVNQHYIIYQSWGADTGFIDVTAYIQNGLNNFTFLTYNSDSGYTWGFQIMQNGDIVFDDTAGLEGAVSANNDGNPEEYQFVYNNTVSINVTKCTTIPTTPTTGEFSHLSLSL